MRLGSAWTRQLATVTRAKDNELPDAILTESGLKKSPAGCGGAGSNAGADRQTSQLLPRIKITELLMDVDDWTGFSRHFTHLKDGAEAKDRTLLLSAILGDAINLGLTKMAESRPRPDLRQAVGCKHGTSATKPIRRPWPSWSTTSIAAFAPWGDGTTSSSDGQRFPRGGRGESTGRQPEVR